MYSKIISLADPLTREQIVFVMWLFTKRKSQIYSLIEKYGTDTELLTHFVDFTLASHPKEISLECYEDYYEQYIHPIPSGYQRSVKTKTIRKWFREMKLHGIDCLNPNLIHDNPLRYGERIVRLPVMEQVEIKKRAGQPRNMEAANKVGTMKEQLGLGIMAIAKAMKKDKRQIRLWYKYYLEEKGKGVIHSS